jgi:hypothetical protein
MNAELSYQLRRSRRRRTLSLEVVAGKLIVKAPHWLEQSEINRFVAEKSPWISQKISQQQQLTHQCPQFTEGSTLLVAGKLRTLHFHLANKKFITTDEHYVHIHLNESLYTRTKQADHTIKQQIKLLIREWLKQQALQSLPKRVELLATSCQLYPNALSIRYYKARWGSCNQKKAIQLNYLLMMFPTWVQDYVIVHELCHLRYLNHSPQFWQLVAKHCAYYVQAQQWIKQHHYYCLGI